MNTREVLASDWIAGFDLNKHEDTDGKWRVEMTSINCNPNIPKIEIYGWTESDTNGGVSKYIKDSWAVTTNYTQNASPGITGNFTLSYTDLKGMDKELKG